MIITVGGVKGGSGKSTVATNLAIIRSAAGREVLLVDTDVQASASHFTMLRNERLPVGAGYTAIRLADQAVRTELLRIRSKYDDVIIDVGAQDTVSQRSALAVSDVVVVPCLPNSFDLWAIQDMADLVQLMRGANPQLRAIAHLNRAQARGSDNAEALDLLADYSETLVVIDAPLGARKAFSNAAADGLAVTEVRPADPKAAEEMMTLYRHAFGIA